MQLEMSSGRMMQGVRSLSWKTEMKERKQRETKDT